MGSYRLEEEELEGLLAPFDDSEVSVIQDGNLRGKTSIDADAKIQRLNLVFGVGGWRHDVLSVEAKETEGKSPMVVARVVLRVGRYRDPKPEEGPEPVWVDRIPPIEQFGGMKVVHGEWGNAYKGAVTSAISKCASMLGVGSYLRGGGGGGRPPQQRRPYQRDDRQERRPPRRREQEARPSGGGGGSPPADEGQAPPADDRQEALAFIRQQADAGVVRVLELKKWLNKCHDYPMDGEVFKAPTKMVLELARILRRNPEAVKRVAQTEDRS